MNCVLRPSRTLALAAALLLQAAVANAATAQVGKNLGFIEPNLATRDQLMALPGVTPAIASAIIAGKPYIDMTALDKVVAPHLAGDAKTELYRKLFIPINLNAATREEILLVPGVGSRMLREFLEYRPYAGMPVFEREIGKYVDAAEVARLAQYVYVPLDLNTATDAQFLTIPGVGSRMVREFKEYRPWTSMEQFDREIGKYVPKSEVARLRRYMTIR
jgi:DNA uptake protein ComE-like DNA-binding protein